MKLLAAEPGFSKFLKAAEFTIIVGLDAITDTRAVDELKKLNKSHPNFKPKLFLHSTGGSIFHPKTMWLKSRRQVKFHASGLNDRLQLNDSCITAAHERQ